MPHCTTTVSVVACCKLPEVAVTVAVYVPAGVPGVMCVLGVDEELPPPQPASFAATSTTIGVAETVHPRSLRLKNIAEASRATVHTHGDTPPGNPP